VDWQIIVALVVMVPVILAPVVLIWFLNLGGIAAALKRVRRRRPAWNKAIVESRADTGG
jgi:hypothetical protein